MLRGVATGVFVAICAGLSTLGCLAREALVQPPVSEPAPAQDPVFVSQVTLSDGDRAAATEGAAIAAMRASDAYRARRYPAFFRLGVGYGAVGRIELATCREQGLDPGYVHMHVTFGVHGAVLRAVVESPTRPSPAALGCIARQLEAIAVPVFEGGDVTLSKSLYLTAGRSGGGGGLLDDGRWGGFGRVTVAPTIAP
jgi:hypothetical protein